MSHGIYFVSPELYSDGLLVRRGEKVQYSASSGELPRSFNLGGARISAADQRVLKVLWRHLRLHIDIKGCPLKRRRGHSPLKKSLRCEDSHARALLQLSQSAQAALFKLPGCRVSLDEYVISPG